MKKYRNEFNTNVAMSEIYKYVKRYRNQVSNFLCPIGGNSSPLSMLTLADFVWAECEQVVFV